MKTAALVLVLALMPCTASAQRARSPADATVFIRLIGTVHAEIDDGGIKRTADVERVEIGTGSGFVISPHGYVVTNAHVVESSEPLRLTRGLKSAIITFRVSSVNVCFTPETMAARGLLAPCAEASVAGADRARDLAILFVNGSTNLPYLPLGDSDVVAAGLPVEALGYPFGREVEIGKVGAASDLVPDVSATPGAISALRASDAGERRYLQITNGVNPGNSGGPVVNRDGFVVGVVHSKLAKADTIAFAIPINEVKDLVDATGLDQAMPVRRLRLGPLQNMEGKGLSLRLPEGFVDRAPFVSRVETEAAAGEVAFRLDRVMSPWTVKRLEEALLSTQTFEALSATPRQGHGRDTAREAQPGPLLGGAVGTGADPNREIRMDYAVFELGAERLVARYVGPAEAMAFNEGVLRDSLISLQGQPFTPAPLPPVEGLTWSTVADTSGRGGLPVPAGWTLEPGRPAPCPGLAEPRTAATAFPPQDASIALRAAIWSGGVTPEAAALACSSRRGTVGQASYSTTASWLGTSYLIEGTFVQAASGQVMQLEVLATDQRSAFAKALLAIWLKRANE
jgi:S1-C subfamily serine protease